MEDNLHFSLTSLLIVSILSFFVPFLIKRIKRFPIPIVVGEIVVGMIIGKSGFDLIEMDSSLHFIQFFGLAYLMFVAGLEIDFGIFTSKAFSAEKEQNKNIIKNPVVLSIAILSITLGFAFFAALVLKRFHLITDPFLMSLIIGTTSLGIVVPILKEKRISSTKYGQYLITGAVVADFVTMLLISVAISLFKGGLRPELGLVFGLLLLVFLIYRISNRLGGHPLFRELAHGTTQIGIRGSFAVMLLFLVLSHTIGVEMILGSFLAGTVMSLVSQSQREEIYHKLDAIGFGFLIPTFFILTGVNFDFSVLIHNPKGMILVPIFFILFYVIKGLPALLLRLVFGWRQSIAGGILLTSKLSLTIAAAAIGLEVKAISVEVSAALLLVSILTSLVSPITFNKLIPTMVENEEEKHVMIIGSTKQAIFLAKRLLEKGTRVVILDSKREKVDDVLLAGIEVVWGDAMDEDLLDELDLNLAKAIIVATGSDEINYKVSSFISTKYEDHVIVLLNDPSYINKASSNEKLKIVNPQLSTVNLLENMVIHPVFASIFEENKGVLMEEVEVTSASFIGKSLRFISLPGDVLIFALYRNGDTLLPHGDTKFEKGDILLVLGSQKDVHQFIQLAR